jgi:glycine cleavage system regulatory protein
MHLETDKKDNMHPIWIELSRKWLESILKTFTKLLEKKDINKYNLKNDW